MLGRRDWLKGAGGLALAACAANPSPVAPPAPPQPTPRPTSKRILVLGGTGFVGPPLVSAARARGHTMTLFNRGKTNRGLFPDVETILGDRMTDLERLKGREWDAVVDTWAPGPTLVRRAAELLKDHVGQYVFVSTISVYKLTPAPIDESSPVLPLPPGVEIGKPMTIDDKTYGPLKVLAEQAAEATMPGRATAVRAGVIVGPGDPSDRFVYWPLRVARGGEVLAPGAPNDPMQFIDVRDLDEWIVRAIEEKHTGVYNAVGPDEPQIGAVLGSMKTALASDARFTWVPSSWLEKNAVRSWGSFPLAVPAEADDSGFARVSAKKAVAKGLRFRSPGETAKAALAWYRAESAERRAEKRPGVTAEREAELLASWRSAMATAERH
jgi:2'-hydroxyisoflavone reductase